ncbi:MAG: hypothetical protein Q6373_009785 [Candidatus Sigynarchaeota archaeon]
MLLTSPAGSLYLLFPVGGCILVWLVLYFARFRHPPLVRKLRDFRWEIRFKRDSRRIILRNIRTRHELQADVFYHAMYPVTGDARYISCPHLWPIDRIPYCLLKKYYRLRPTCQELLLELEREEPDGESGSRR